MLIESPDILRLWLTNTLLPICDADPAALAKYVMALLKKDKTETELKAFCADQLDVFLQKETKAFVDQLFNVMKDKSYLNPPAVVAKAEPVEPQAQPLAKTEASVDEDQTRLTTPPPGVPFPPDFNQTSNDAKKASDGAERPRSRDRDRQRMARRVERSPITAPPGSQKTGTAVSIGRSRLSRSRSRERDRSRRHQSPVRGNGGVAATAERTAGTGSGDARNAPTVVTSDKENRESRHRRIERSPRGTRRRSTSRGEKRPRSKDSSPLRESGKHHAAAETNGEKKSVSDRDSKRKRQRCRDYDEKGFCMKGDSCVYDHGPDPVVVEELALPRIIPGIKPGTAPLVDFSQPPPGYIHPPPPPGVDHSSFAPPPPVPSSQSVAGAASSIAGGAATTEAYNPEAPALSSSSGSTGLQQAAAVSAPLHHTLATSYGASQVVPPAPVLYPPPMTSQPPPTYTVQYTAPPGAMVPPELSHLRSRDLLQMGDGQQQASMVGIGPVPPPQINTGPHQPRVVYAMSGGGQHPQASAGMRMIRPPVQHDRSCKTLEVRRIPPHLNTIFKLNDHFSQFGQVVNIQICYNNDREAALVSFANRHQAMSAYKSTTPVFNNRFVRMFWHNPEGQAPASNGSGSGQPQQQYPDQHLQFGGGDGAPDQRVPIKDRLGPAPADPSTTSDDDEASRGRGGEPADTRFKSVVTSSTVGNLSKTVYNPAALKTASVVANREQVVRANSVEKSEVWKKQVGLQKAKMDLFTKQLQQQKMLVRQLEKCKDPLKKKEIAKMVKSSQTSMNKLKDELSSLKITPPPSKKTKEQIERQILDTELEMMNQNQTGAEKNSDLHDKLLDLKRQLIKLSEMSAEQTVADNEVAKPVSSTRPRRQSSTSSGRPIPSFANLDKRPKELLISGFDESDNDALVDYFKSFGVVEDLEFMLQHKEQPRRVLVVYKTRREAEMALAGGKDFKDGALEIQWYNRRSQLPSEKDDPKSELSAQDLLATLDDEDDASSDENQQGDPDEEVPEIERGWKRRS